MRIHRSVFIPVLVTVVASLLLASQASTCPFCVDQRGPTLVGDFDQAEMVLFGNLKNAKLGGGGLETGTTDFHIKEVLKDNPFIKGKSIINLPRYLPNKKDPFVIFLDVFKGVPDPYRGIEVGADSDLVEYLKGALAAKHQPIGKRLRYCFDYLTSTDPEVAIDAYREFAKADYTDYQKMAENLPADTIAKWLEDPNTPAFRYGLYSSLLGHCGTAKHGEVLRKMLETPKVRKSSGIDGVLVGHLLILDREKKKQEGLKYLSDILDNPKEEFLMRYAVLRTLRFFWYTRTDVLTKDEIVHSVARTLNHADIADFGIEDLRKWKRWDMADNVLALFGKKSHDIRIVRRAVLRFALQCPSKSCRDFVREQERRDREWVNETRELLELETGTTAKTDS